MRAFLWLASLGAWAGCQRIPPGGEDSGPEGMTGVVSGSDGMPASGARVVAMERVSHAHVQTVTEDDGSYTLSLPDGDWDVGAAVGEETFFRGPISAGSVAELDLQVPVPPQDDPTLVFGTIRHLEDVDVTGWTVEANSSHVPCADGVECDRTLASVTVGSDGEFALTGIPAATLDLDIFDTSGALVEFVDIAKLEGPCGVELDLGGVANVFRAHEHANSPEDPRPEARRGYNVPFDVTVVGDTTRPLQEIIYTFSNGLLEPDVGNVQVAPESRYLFWAEPGTDGGVCWSEPSSSNEAAEYTSFTKFPAGQFLCCAIHNAANWNPTYPLVDSDGPLGMGFELTLISDDYWWYTHALRTFAWNPELEIRVYEGTAWEQILLVQGVEYAEEFADGIGAHFPVNEIGFTDGDGDTHSLSIWGNWGWQMSHFNADNVNIYGITVVTNTWVAQDCMRCNTCAWKP